MSDMTAKLDADEVLHLAIEAARRDEHAAALNYLKAGLERFPDDARMAYMLGAEYAQIELFDRAEEHMGRAIALAPELHTARFQLGLLQLTQARLEDAKTTWRALGELPSEHALRLYKEGLEALAADDFSTARALLQRGLTAEGGSPDLTKDMTGLLDRIPEHAADDAIAKELGEDGEETSHVLLNAYRNPSQAD